jgi:hypothetical protein
MRMLMGRHNTVGSLSTTAIVRRRDKAPAENRVDVAERGVLLNARCAAALLR